MIEEDSDGDGFDVPDDCDDNNAAVHPGADEVPYDGVDQDCDGHDLTDIDGDGDTTEPYSQAMEHLRERSTDLGEGGTS